MEKLCAIITATGSYIPARIVQNGDFLENEFYDKDGKKFKIQNKEIIENFKEITHIKERRYATDDIATSDIAFYAAKNALEHTDKETLDYIIVAHNFGDVKPDNKRSEMVPSLASRVKSKLEIENPKTIAYDLVFGCPGWLQAVIQADYFIKSGDAKKALVIGAEILSRVSDPHDRDSMIYSDGAGAVLIEAARSEEPIGILAHETRSYANNLLRMEKSYNPNYKGNELFLKMDGHKLYKEAIKKVPLIINECIKKAGLSLEDISKLYLHQANGKMDDTMTRNVYGKKEIPQNVMPMTLPWLGNNSVATVPIMLDLICKGKIENQSFKPGDIIVVAYIGAGINLNVVIYKVPSPALLNTSPKLYKQIKS